MPIGLAHVTRSSRFAQKFDVVRRPEVVNGFGESTIVAPTRLFGLIGTVLPVSQSLDRQSDQQDMPKRIIVHTSFRLRGPTPGYQADIVRWNGDSYLVVDVDDFSKFGAGHLSVTCSSIDYQDQPPTQPADGGALDYSNPKNSGLVGAL